MFGAGAGVVTAGADAGATSAGAFEAGVIVRPLSAYYSAEQAARRGLLLGYACVPNDKMAPAFDSLARVIETQIDKRRIERVA